MKNYENRHLYMVSAIVAIVAMPLVLFVGPFILHGIFFDSTSVFLLQTPNSSRWLFGLACVVLAIFLMLAFFFQRFKFVHTGIGAILALLLLAAGTYNYQYLSREEVSWSDPLSYKVHTYSWDQIEEVILHVPEEKEGEEKEKHKMEFIFKDGNSVSFVRDITFQEAYGDFYSLYKQHNFRYDATNNLNN